MKFYMTPGSCSTGIHILLEELELVFEAHVLSIPNGDLQRTEYLGINPRGTIPALVTPEGQAICEFQAIAWWLAKRYPQKGLLPCLLEDDVYLMSLTNYAVGYIHGKGFTRIFTPESYQTPGASIADIKAQGLTIVEESFDTIAGELRGKDYILDDFTIADTALFYVEFWADRIGLTMPERLQQHYQRMLKRRAVRQVLTEEGYHAVFAQIT